MKMRRLLSCIMALLLVISMLPIAALADTVENNPKGETVSEIKSGETMRENKGTVDINNGKIGTSNGTVTENNGDIQTNASAGKVETNNGTVTYNKGEVKNNTTDGVVANNYGEVDKNYGTVNQNTNLIRNDGEIVQSGYIDQNRGTVGTNDTTINQNKGTVTDNNGTINTSNGKVFTNDGKIGTNAANGIVGTNNNEVGTNKGTVTTNGEDGTVGRNLGSIGTNEGTVKTNKSEITTNNGEVGDFDKLNKVAEKAINNGEHIADITLDTGNFGTITDNDGVIYYNGEGGTVTNNNGGILLNKDTVENNNVYVGLNAGTVETNNMYVGQNAGTVETNNKRVGMNIGTVVTNTINGIVYNETTQDQNDQDVTGTVTNNYGTVYNLVPDNDGEPYYQATYGVEVKNTDGGAGTKLLQAVENTVVKLAELFKRDGYKLVGYDNITPTSEDSDEDADGLVAAAYALNNDPAASELSATEFQATRPSILKLLWEKIAGKPSGSSDEPETKTVQNNIPTSLSAGQVKVGAYVRRGNLLFRIIEVTDNDIRVATVGKLSEQALADMMGFLKQHLSDAQIAKINGEPALLEQELVTYFFGDSYEHIAFRAARDLFA